MRKFIVLPIIAFIMTACSVSYQFNGASIDYTKIRTIQIKEFKNQAPLVYNPLTQIFNERMVDMFIRNTKLQLSNNSPDLEIEGEIIRYDLTPLSVQQNNLASETRLTMAVRMRFRNNKNPQEDKEETITAFRDFPSSQLLTDVQDPLIRELTVDIVDQLFNATMSNW